MTPVSLRGPMARTPKRQAARTRTASGAGPKARRTSHSGAAAPCCTSSKRQRTSTAGGQDAATAGTATAGRTSVGTRDRDAAGLGSQQQAQLAAAAVAGGGGQDRDSTGGGSSSMMTMMTTMLQQHRAAAEARAGRTASGLAARHSSMVVASAACTEMAATDKVYASHPQPNLLFPHACTSSRHAPSSLPADSCDEHYAADRDIYTVYLPRTIPVCPGLACVTRVCTCK